jgi:hypothetical protein
MTREEIQLLKEKLIKFEERENTEKYFMKGVSLGGCLWVGIMAWTHYFRSLEYVENWIETSGQGIGVVGFAAIIWHIKFLHDRKKS